MDSLSKYIYGEKRLGSNFQLNTLRMSAKTVGLQQNNFSNKSEYDNVGKVIYYSPSLLLYILYKAEFDIKGGRVFTDKSVIFSLVFFIHFFLSRQHFW